MRVVAEFFSGIGGLHYALKRSGVRHRVVRAFDVDSSAVETYRHNLPETRVSTQNIASLTSEDLRELVRRIDARIPSGRLEGELDEGTILDHWRQLEEVAAEHQLQPAECLLGASDDPCDTLERIE